MGDESIGVDKALIKMPVWLRAGRGEYWGCIDVSAECRMDYEEEYEELELVEVCEDCERLQQQINERTMRLRETGFGSELQQKRAKSLLDAAVQEQLRHQQEHDLEEELPEDCWFAEALRFAAARACGSCIVRCIRMKDLSG
jgi:hypothetical protein